MDQKFLQLKYVNTITGNLQNLYNKDAAQCISREYFRADARAVRSWIKEEGCATFTILKQLNYLNST